MNLIKNLFKKDVPILQRTAEDWELMLKKKTAGNLLIGLLLGIAFMISILALAYLF